MAWADRLKYAAATVTALGATVALVVNYRKQRDAEDGWFETAFADACAQLGGEATAVRIGGAYDLAALAYRQSHRARRQQCIDALCGYLLLPYDPAAGGDHTISITQEHASEEGDETATTSIFRANNREVRLTIISVIARHLQQARGASSWVGHDFDFAGATFDGGDFTRCRFTGNDHFDDAKFTGGVVTFDGGRFTGSQVTHNGVPFRGWPAE